MKNTGFGTFINRLDDISTSGVKTKIRNYEQMLNTGASLKRDKEVRFEREMEKSITCESPAKRRRLEEMSKPKMSTRAFRSTPATWSKGARRTRPSTPTRTFQSSKYKDWLGESRKLSSISKPLSLTKPSRSTGCRSRQGRTSSSSQPLPPVPSQTWSPSSSGNTDVLWVGQRMTKTPRGTGCQTRLGRTSSSPPPHTQAQHPSLSAKTDERWVGQTLTRPRLGRTSSPPPHSEAKLLGLSAKSDILLDGQQMTKLLRGTGCEVRLGRTTSPLLTAQTLPCKLSDKPDTPWAGQRPTKQPRGTGCQETRRSGASSPPLQSTPTPTSRRGTRPCKTPELWPLPPPAPVGTASCPSTRAHSSSSAPAQGGTGRHREAEQGAERH